jgi:hypothetical protein
MGREIVRSSLDPLPLELTMAVSRYLYSRSRSDMRIVDNDSREAVTKI